MKLRPGDAAAGGGERSVRRLSSRQLLCPVLRPLRHSPLPCTLELDTASTKFRKQTSPDRPSLSIAAEGSLSVIEPMGRVMMAQRWFSYCEVVSSMSDLVHESRLFRLGSSVSVLSNE